MLDVFTLVLNLFGSILSFLDSFIIFANVSLLRFLIIVFIFFVALKFLVKRGA